MTDDLVQRLREIAEPDTYIGDNNEKEVCTEAADRIEELEEENSEVKKHSLRMEKMNVVLIKDKGKLKLQIKNDYLKSHAQNG